MPDAFGTSYSIPEQPALQNPGMSSCWAQSPGLQAGAAQQVLTRAFYSLQESKIPAQSAALAMFLNLVLNLTLVWPLGTGGLAAATAARANCCGSASVFGLPETLF